MFRFRSAKSDINPAHPLQASEANVRVHIIVVEHKLYTVKSTTNSCVRGYGIHTQMTCVSCNQNTDFSHSVCS